MANSVIIDNSAYYGGGVFAAYNGTVSMDSCTVEKNRALVGGGGFHLKGSTAELTQCVVQNNRAGVIGGSTLSREGGGLAIIGSQVVMTGCVIRSNEANKRGGVMYVKRSNSVVNMEFCAVYDNVAKEGAGGVHAYLSPEITVRSSVIHSNIPNDVQEFSMTTTGIGAEVTPDAITAKLHPNTPNPFNPTTTIHFSTPSNERMSLAVYNLGGQLVRTLSDGPVDQVHHTVVWDGLDHAGHPAASGVYLYRLKGDGWELTRRMVLIR